MKEIYIIYHHEDEGWWAESPDLAGFSAAGATLAEVQQQGREGLAFFCCGDVEVKETVIYEEDRKVTIDMKGLEFLRQGWSTPWKQTSEMPESRSAAILPCHLSYLNLTPRSCTL